jgi:hypothetical protein
VHLSFSPTSADYNEITHAYSRAAKFAVTLTAIENQGCSTAFFSIGSAVLC